MVALQDNLQSVRHFTALGYREALAVHTAAKRQHARMEKR